MDLLGRNTILLDFDTCDRGRYINKVHELNESYMLIESNLENFKDLFLDKPFTAIVCLPDYNKLLYVKIKTVVNKKNRLQGDFEDEDGLAICLFPTYIYRIEYELIHDLMTSKRFYDFIFRLDILEEFIKNCRINYDSRIELYNKKSK